MVGLGLLVGRLELPQELAKLATLVAGAAWLSGQDGKAALTDPAEPHVGIVDTLPERNGHRIRLIDLAIHASGLPREPSPVASVTVKPRAPSAASSPSSNWGSS